MDEDAVLIERFVAGEADAMERLVSRHGPSVYAFVRRFLGSAPIADDVYQDVWLKVIRYASRFEGRSLFTTWLFQVTRNVCMDHLRSKKRRKDALSLESDEGGEDSALRERVASERPGTPDEAAANEEQSAVLAALASLPDEQREVFLLREKTELTFEEIAKLAGISPNTAKSRMRYALENLRRALRGHTGGVAHGM